MPSYGADILAPKLDFYNPNLELLAQNIDKTSERHNATLNSYARSVDDITNNETLHPEERSKRLQKLEDDVFGNIDSFSGNVSQASDSIFNRLLKERQDPFYNADKQYTNIFNTAQINRSALTKDGKSVFMVDSQGRAIDKAPTLFNEDGSLKSKDEFQFNYEGMLDYSAKAETLVDNLVGNLSTVDPTLAGRPEAVRELMEGYYRTGTFQSNNKQLNRMFNETIRDYEQSSEGDQLRRRGKEGEIPNLIQRAFDERRLTSEDYKYQLLANDPYKTKARGGSNLPDKIEIPDAVLSEKKLVDTEEGAKAVDKVISSATDLFTQNSVSNFLSSSTNTYRGYADIYGNLVFDYKNGLLTTPKVQIGDIEFDVPITTESANEIRSVLNENIAELTTTLEEDLRAVNLFHRTLFSSDEDDGAGKGLINMSKFAFNNAALKIEKRDDDWLSEDNWLFADATRLRIKRSNIPEAKKQEILVKLNALQEASKLNSAIKSAETELKENDKKYDDKYSIKINSLIESGLAKDKQEAILFIESKNAKNAIKTKNTVGWIEPATKEAAIAKINSLTRDGEAKFYNSDDGKEIVFPTDNKAYFGDNSVVAFDFTKNTFVVDKKYILDPQSLYNSNKAMQPALDMLDIVNSFDDLSNENLANPKITNPHQNFMFDIDGNRFEIKAGSTVYSDIMINDDAANEVVVVKSGNDEATYPLREFSQAVRISAVNQVRNMFIPSSAIGDVVTKSKNAKKVFGNDM